MPLAVTGRDPSSIDNRYLVRVGMNSRPTNVESSIPRTKERDPNNFPYEFREYPKAMNMVATKEYLETWMERHKQTDDNGKSYWHGCRPIVGKSVVPFLDELGEPVFVYGEDEEQEFRANNPDVLTIVSQAAEIDTLRAENARLQALIAENAKLKNETKAAPAKDEQDEGEPEKDAKPENALGTVMQNGKPKPKVELPKRL